MNAIPKKYEHAAESLVKHYKVTEQEAQVLTTDHRFAVAAWLSEEIGENMDTLRPDLDHLRTEEGDLDTSEADFSDSCEIEARRDLYAALTITGDVALNIAQSVLDREIEKRSFEEVLDRAIETGGVANE